MQKANKILIWILLSALLCGLFASCKQEPPPQTEISFKDLTWAVGAPLPKPQDFVVGLPDGWNARFAEDYRFTELGSHTLTLILTDAKGRETSHKVGFTLVLDKEPPIITGVKDLSAYIGDGISYRSGVTVSDNCEGSVTLTVDSSAVNQTQEGVYPVIYTATDAAGNVTTVKVNIYIYREQITEEMLNGVLDRIIAEQIPQNASAETKARAVYEYVFYSIAYDDSSDKSDWVRAAYEGLRTGKGDCFTYFAISKAFFKRLGIDSMDIKRTEGIVDERHYWNLVNIGSKDAPRWYHFDACRLSGVQHSGCLLTEKQIDAYTKQRAYENGVTGYFYVYDRTGYPTTDSTIITPTPTLEPYY